MLLVNNVVNIANIVNITNNVSKQHCQNSWTDCDPSFHCLLGNLLKSAVYKMRKWLEESMTCHSESILNSSKSPGSIY